MELTAKEKERLSIIQDCLLGKLTKSQAAVMLGISSRQVKRLKAKVREQGSVGVVHGLKERTSNHHIDLTVKEKTLDLIKEKYSDFRPTFATEKLSENHDIHISYGTTRLWMIEKKLWKPHKQKHPQYFSWRPRKEYFGELQQFDGSYHYWFEDRYKDHDGNPIEVCLLASIDDATGNITKAEFSIHEGVIPVFTFWKAYVEDDTLGKPVSIYLDRFSTYKINHKAALDNSELKTQFQRAMGTLGVAVIFANSPQAKGRVERLFETLQDRLVKELRLAQVNNPVAGNTFLKEIFIPKFNQQFGVVPAKEGTVHKKLTTEERENLEHIFSMHEIRRVNNDFTIQFKNTFYQLTEIQPTTIRPQERILVETWLDGSIHFLLKNHELKTISLPEKPKKQRIRQPIILTTHTLNWKPPINHPWKKGYK